MFDITEFIKKYYDYIILTIIILCVLYFCFKMENGELCKYATSNYCSDKTSAITYPTIGYDDDSTEVLFEKLYKATTISNRTIVWRRSFIISTFISLFICIVIYHIKNNNVALSWWTYFSILCFVFITITQLKYFDNYHIYTVTLDEAKNNLDRLRKRIIVKNE